MANSSKNVNRSYINQASSVPFGPPSPQQAVPNYASGQAQQANAYSDQYYNEISSQENKYIDSLIQQAGGQRDLMLKQLDAEHKLALGNDDTEQAKFLESVADSLEQRIGRIPYDYQRYTARELEDYARGSDSIKNNKDLALQKLSNDEKNTTNDINLQQKNTNTNTLESLNERGLLEGQNPTGANQPTAIGGLTGLAGEQVQPVNQQFSNMRGALASNTALGAQGINLDASQRQGALDFSHRNTLQDLTVDSRRGAQNAANTYTFGQQQANQTYETQKSALERERARLLQKDKQYSYNQGGISSGIVGSGS